MWSYTEPDKGTQLAQAKVKKNWSAVDQWSARCWLQLQYVSTVGTAYTAQKYYFLPDQLYARSSVEKAVCDVNDNGGSFVSDTKFVSRLGHERYIGLLRYNF